MKILFIARHCAYLRNFEGPLRELARRGHQIRLAVERDDTIGSQRLIDDIIAAHPAVSLARAPVRAKDEGAERIKQLRLALDYIRFLDPMYHHSPHLRGRAEARAPEGIVSLLARPVVRRRPGRAAVSLALQWLERALPPSARILEWMRSEAPDLVLITPLIELGSQQFDYLQAAKLLGIRTALPVTSWDHLSSKALIRNPPDLVLVWNPVQRDEAIRLHGVPASRITVTGAQAYDHWFTWTPKRSREAFCRDVGLPADRPFILYTCSSLFKGTADETLFVEKWLREIRASNDPVLRTAGVLIRPHPGRLEEWTGFDFSKFGDVAFWGRHPVDEASRTDYFESMHYSAAVVGLTTSAFLEAAIVGRPVHTVLLPKYSRNNQEGTIHFQYLLTVNGGLLHTSRTFQEHTGQLAQALREPVAVDPRSRAFVEGFIRPFGIDVAATPRFVDAIEALGRRPAPRAQAGVIGEGLARRMLPAVLKALGRTRKNGRAAVAEGKPTPSEKRITAHRAKKHAVEGPSVLAPRAGKSRQGKALTGSDTPEARDTRAYIERLSESGTPIVIGPWLSEAGFELMYWIPFLAWAKRYGRLDPSRLVVISRGGAASWYAHLTTQYEDAFSLFTPEEFRRRNDERIQDKQGVQKHLELSPFDREIVERVAARRGLAEYEVLHPSLMYGLFQLFWRQHQPVTVVEMFTAHALIAEAEAERDIRRQLPERYIAAKFYSNVALPDVPGNHAFVQETLAALAADHDVVLLNTGVRFDDHVELGAAAARGRLHSVEHLMTPQTNLAVQSAIIRHADAYVGTYGGFSYLAPLLSTDAVTFYSHPSAFRWDHLEVAKRVFAGLGGGGFSEVDVRHRRALQLAFGTKVAEVAPR